MVTDKGGLSELRRHQNTSWEWEDHGVYDPHVPLISTPTMLWDDDKYQGVWAIDISGNLVERYSTDVGHVNMHWARHVTPADYPKLMGTPIGCCDSSQDNYMGVFAVGETGELIELWTSDYSDWGWINYGKPSDAVSLTADLSMRGDGAGSLRIFGIGSDGNLWRFDRWNRQSWRNLGRGDGSKGIRLGPYAPQGEFPNLMIDEDGAVQRYYQGDWDVVSRVDDAFSTSATFAYYESMEIGTEHWFALGIDFNLYGGDASVDRLTLEAPPGITLESPPQAISIYSPDHCNRDLYVFCVGSDGELWGRHRGTESLDFEDWTSVWDSESSRVEYTGPKITCSSYTLWARGIGGWFIKDDQTLCAYLGKDGKPESIGGGSGAKAGPMTIAERWPKLPAPFYRGIDAMSFVSLGGITGAWGAYLIKEESTVCIDPGQDGKPTDIDSSVGGQAGPMSIAQRWPRLPAEFHQGIDAMTAYDFGGSTGWRAWLIKGQQTICIDPRLDGRPASVGSGPGGRAGPMSIAQRWPRLPTQFHEGIDAMDFFYKGGLTGKWGAWLIRGDQSVCIDPGQDGKPTNIDEKNSFRAGPILWANRWPKLPWVTSHMGKETDDGSWRNAYATQFPFQIEGRNYFFGQNQVNGYWFIQELKSDGRMGSESDNGSWGDVYPVMFHLGADGKALCFAHKADSSKSWFIRELKSGGKMGGRLGDGTLDDEYSVMFPLRIGNSLYIYGQNVRTGDYSVKELMDERDESGEVYRYGLSDNVDVGTWPRGYDVQIPLYVDEKVYMYSHSTATKEWFLCELESGGKVIPSTLLGEGPGSGVWRNPYQVTVPYAVDGRTHIYAQDMTTDKWFLQQLNGDGTMGSRVGEGSWRNSYRVQFSYNSGGREYLYGQNQAGKNWFIQELLGKSS
ncbi:hypothetical protein [Streptomyces sp. NPDC050659]|uniref:hypothetical protein n=1 Tax=Streptomyces sp. NPDC050659 TaxID=3157215 RepID=UPI003428B086